MASRKKVKAIKQKALNKTMPTRLVRGDAQKDLQIGYVVKVDPTTDKGKACSYLPHHPVSNENIGKSGESPMHPVFSKVSP